MYFKKFEKRCPHCGGETNRRFFRFTKYDKTCPYCNKKFSLEYNAKTFITCIPVVVAFAVLFNMVWVINDSVELMVYCLLTGAYYYIFEERSYLSRVKVFLPENTVDVFLDFGKAKPLMFSDNIVLQIRSESFSAYAQFCQIKRIKGQRGKYTATMDRLPITVTCPEDLRFEIISQNKTIAEGYVQGTCPLNA